MKPSETQHLANLEKEIKDLREQNAAQLDMYQMTTLYLKRLQDELRLSEARLRKTNQNITDSINYARHIQHTLAVQPDALVKLWPESFLWHRPRDIVSGDFLWAHQGPEHLMLAVGDCTGHGVPGAMLSVFVVGLLNQVMQQTPQVSPAQFIERVDALMEKYLNQYTINQHDSVELAVLQIDHQRRRAHFAGARRPLLYWHDGHMQTIAGARFVLGNSARRLEAPQDHQLELAPGDQLYLYSDGYVDQLDESGSRKIGSRRFGQQLADTALLPPDERCQSVQLFFEQWMGLGQQTDDVLVLGLPI